MEEAQRREFFRDLLKSLGPVTEEEKRTQGTFAACEGVKPSQGFRMMGSLQVEGAGEMQLPLSAADTVKLRAACEQAPFGRGSATLVDTNVRRCWQVDASKVSFPGTPTFLSDTVQALAMQAVSELGVDGVEVRLEAHLYKLLLYEAGGHFTFHRDTEKERGMFATLILQLPTAEGYTGGELLVKHYNEVKNFNSQMISSVGFCYTVFFADCLHELRPIESGARLCLAFNLVRRDSSSEPILRGLISRRVQSAEGALEPWLRGATESGVNFIGEKLAFPLQHKYTEANLSFAGLKGDDSVLAEVLMNVRNQNKQKCLDIYLCLVTKYQMGEPSSPGGYSHGDHSMDEVIEESIEFKKWIGVDDRTTSVAWIKELMIDFEKEGVVEELWEDCFFDDDPDRSAYEGYTGNAGPTVEYWYHTAMLVVWPKAQSVSVRCQLGVSQALDSLQINDPNFSSYVHQIVEYCLRHPLEVWNRMGDAQKDTITPRLLNLCSRANLGDDVREILQLLGKVFVFHKQTKTPPFRLGVRNPEVAKAIASVVQKFGWELTSSCIIDLAKNPFALAQRWSFAELAKQLISKGSTDVGEHVANTVFAALESRIALLESRMPPKPVFDWRQPRASLPEQPDVERFLKGPDEKLVITGFERITAAKSFAYRYCTTDGAGYSVTATTGGKARDSFCEITKTRRIFDVVVENWRKKQREVQAWRLELGKLRAAIPKIDKVTVTARPDGSGQRDEHRPRLDADTGNTTNNRPETSPAVLIDLTVNTFPDGPLSKRAKSSGPLTERAKSSGPLTERAKSSGGKIEVIDLTTDRC